MRRLIAVILSALFVFSLFSCGDKNKDVGNTDTSALVESVSDLPYREAVSSTLMVYMVGSDLEANGGNATEDLIEITESGIDLSVTNVVVYAGGSRKWHNDSVSSEEMHSVLELGEGGFVTVENFENRAMGDSECFLDFLNYAYENYPAEKHSLILWNHGMGPLKGYAKDMFYEGDHLTLIEMKTALEASPFKGENKLEWLGFDACLMSSAELAAVWSPHADYLVASQETEPHFGWDYSFLEDYGYLETTVLIKGDHRRVLYRLRRIF